MADDPDFEYVMVDSSIVRAHQHAAGKRGAETRAIGRSRGGLTTRIHAAVDALDNPLRLILLPGQAGDYTQAEALIQDLPAQHVLADKGYDSKTCRDAIAGHGAVPVIPLRKTSPKCLAATPCTASAISSSASSSSSSTSEGSQHDTNNTPRLHVHARSRLRSHLDTMSVNAL
jgi:transposase